MFLSVGTRSLRNNTSTRTGSDLCLAIPDPPSFSYNKTLHTNKQQGKRSPRVKSLGLQAFFITTLRERSVFIARGVGIFPHSCVGGRYSPVSEDGIPLLLRSLFFAPGVGIHCARGRHLGSTFCAFLRERSVFLGCSPTFSAPVGLLLAPVRAATAALRPSCAPI